MNVILNRIYRMLDTQHPFIAIDHDTKTDIVRLERCLPQDYDRKTKIIAEVKSAEMDKEWGST